MEIFTNAKIGVCLFLGTLCILVFMVAVLCLILGIFGYRLHISAKKIEILPAKESPNKKH